MAIYHLSVQIIKRSDGRSATAAAAYRSGSRLVDETEQLTFDYRRKTGIDLAEIRAPHGAPQWVRDRQVLWNRVEATERRKDAQVAREIVVAVPHELDRDAQRRLVRNYVDRAFVQEGMVADVAIHRAHRDGDQRNHHAHILLTMRRIEQDGFGKKEREWNSREHVEHWRALWCDMANTALERAGHAPELDHRSYARQGIEKKGTVHMGPIATDLERAGIPSDRGDLNRMIEEYNRMSMDEQRDENPTTMTSENEPEVEKERSAPTRLDAKQESDHDGRALFGTSSEPTLVDLQLGSILDRLRFEARRAKSSNRRQRKGESERKSSTTLHLSPKQRVTVVTPNFRSAVKTQSEYGVRAMSADAFLRKTKREASQGVEKTSPHAVVLIQGADQMPAKKLAQVKERSVELRSRTLVLAEERAQRKARSTAEQTSGNQQKSAVKARHRDDGRSRAIEQVKQSAQKGRAGSRVDRSVEHDR